MNNFLALGIRAAVAYDVIILELFNGPLRERAERAGGGRAAGLRRVHCAIKQASY